MGWVNMTDIVYPVGSIYISVSTTSPATLFGGSWSQIASDRVLMGTTTASKLGTTVNSGLPNITGSLTMTSDSDNAGVDGTGTGSGAITAKSMYGYGSYGEGSSTWTIWGGFSFSAANSNSIYGGSSIVQPPAVYVYIWKRTAQLG